MTTMQIAIDCRDPHALVAFWAAAFGYEVERHDELVRRMLDAGHAEPEHVVEVDGHLAWKSAAACRHPTLPRLLFQVVPEEKVGKNRVHIDVHVGDDVEREALVERLVGLGATKLWDGQQGPQSWVTLADPEGNEFCVG